MKFIKRLFQKVDWFDLLIYFFIFIYFLAVVSVSLHRYWQYDAFHYDLAIFDTAIWKVSKLKAPIIDHLDRGGRWIFADHFVPSIFLLSPFYWLTDKTEMLMVVQSAAAGISLIICFLIAKKLVKSKLIQVSLLIAFAGFIGLQYALISNFHPIVVAILPLMFCFWAIQENKWKLFWPSFFIMLGFKEDMFLVGLGLGIYIFLKQKSLRKTGFFVLMVSLIYGLLVIKFIIPAFLGNKFAYSPGTGKPILSWVTDFIYPLEKLRTLFYSFATFAFLPLFYPPLLPTILITFYSRFVLVGGPARYGLAMHYSALVSPLMFMASAELISILETKKKFKQYLKFIGLLIVFIVFVFHRFIFHGPLDLAMRTEFYQNTKRHKFLNDFVSKVPSRGSIMSQNHLTPHFIHRDDWVFLIREEYWQYNPKYIVIELRGGQNANNFWPMQEWAVKRMVENLKEDQEYKLIYNQNEQYIFQKN